MKKALTYIAWALFAYGVAVVLIAIVAWVTVLPIIGMMWLQGKLS